MAGCGGFDDGQQIDSRGFAMSWKLVDATATDPLNAPGLTCAQAGVATVLLDALDDAGGARYRTEFSCDTLEGVTPAIPASTYQLLQIARASDGTARSQIEFRADNESDASADLGLTIFQIPK
jgi:hypothetical protein